MDTDSFLNLLSSGFNDIDVDWVSRSDADFYAEHAWIGDGGEEDNIADAAPASCAPPITSRVNHRIADNPSSEYSSVLKLCDIASALHNFSRASGLNMNGTARKCKQETPSPVQISSLNAVLPSTPAMDLQTSNLLSAASMDASHSSTCSVVKSSSSLDIHINTHPSWVSPMDTDEEEDEYGEDEDVKPYPVSEVRIVRRQNRKCGQGAKRMKFVAAHVKAEDASSCDAGPSVPRRAADDKEGMSQREVHILSERQRRKSMRESFSILQSMLPKLEHKHMDRITVLTEVIGYIQTLRGTLEELERKKLDILELLGIPANKPNPHPNHADVLPTTVTYVDTNHSSSDDKAERPRGWCSLQENGEVVATVEVTVRTCGADVFITLNAPRRKGVWSAVLLLFQKFGIDVSNATLASSGDSSFHCIHGKAIKMSNIEGVDLQEVLEGVIVKELQKRPRK